MAGASTSGLRRCRCSTAIAVFASIVIWAYDPFAFCELPLVCVLIGLTPARRELAPDRVARDEIVLVVLARNEHLAEWIAHHLHIGVGRIHVLDDSMPHGDQGVRPSDVASGRVVLHNVTVPEGRRFFLGVKAVSTPPLRLPGDVENQLFYSRQMIAYHDMWRRLARSRVADQAYGGSPVRDHLWVGLLDADEFLNPQGGSLRMMLHDARMAGARSVHVMRRSYGPSGHSARPTSAGVRASYTWRQRDADPNATRRPVRHKGLALLGSITGLVPGCVHSFFTRSWLADVVLGRANDGAHCNYYPTRWAGKLVGGVMYPSPSTLSIAHYETRSVEECFARSAMLTPGTMMLKARPCCDPKLTQVCRLYASSPDSKLRHLTLCFVTRLYASSRRCATTLCFVT